MQSELINIYIQKQKYLIAELQTKLLLTEAQLELNADLLKKANEEIILLKSNLEKLQVKRTKTSHSE